MILNLVLLTSISYIVIISFLLATESYILLAGLVSALPVSLYLFSRLYAGKKGNLKKYPARKYPFILIYILPIVPTIAATYFMGYDMLEVSTIYSLTIAFGMSLAFNYAVINLPLAIKHKKEEDAFRSEPMPLFLPSMTIIVPAYNEEPGIGRTLEALLETDYDNKEIIVVDDGSKDKTHFIASTYIKKAPPGRLSIIRKENGGKASAINSALRFAKGEIIVIIDADSIVARDTLRELARQFKDKDVGAIAGNVKVLNRNNFWSKLQVLEYEVGISLFKRAYALFGVVMVVPGSLGAFRKDVLIQSGLYDSDTLTEDFDITVKVLKTGKKVVMAPNAISYTEVPESFRELYKQRTRWQGGNIQTLLKHKDLLTDSGYGMVHRYAYPLMLLTMITLPFLGMIVSAFIVVGLLSGMWFILLTSFVVFSGLQVVLGALAIILDEEDFHPLIYSPLMVVGFKQILDFFLVKSVFDVLLKRNLKWNASKRYGMVAGGALTKR